jgi:chromosome partitioning protein
MGGIIAVAGQKGGSGKSTLLLNLAVEMRKAGQTVTIIDIDPQATASKWGDRRESVDGPKVVSAQAERLDKVMTEIDSDFILIDTAGKADREAIAVSKRANLMLLPSRPTITDIETLATMADILKLTKSRDRASVVWNACLNPTDGRITEGLDLIHGMGLTAAPMVVCQRVILADAMVAGMGASELDPSSKAAAEIAALYTWVMERMA